MVSDLVFYQLVLIALVWLCVMLQWAWPSDPAAACPTLPEPATPLPKRKREPTPFAGLITKPHCDACTPASHPRPLAPRPRRRVSSCRGGTAARWTPRAISAPIPTVPVAVGRAGGMFAPMSILVEARDGNAIVPRAGATFWRPTARFFMVNG
jgi:hypothetical protein